MTQTVKELHYHRNGICGTGFHVAIVEDTEEGAGKMLVVRFPQDPSGINCAAFNLDKLPNIRFTENSYRGDHFHEVVDKAIAARNAERPDNKVAAMKEFITTNLDLMSDGDVEKLYNNMNTDPEACPGCGCKPGDGLTPGCTDKDGCGAPELQPH